MKVGAIWRMCGIYRSVIYYTRRLPQLPKNCSVSKIFAHFLSSMAVCLHFITRCLQGDLHNFYSTEDKGDPKKGNNYIHILYRIRVYIHTDLHVFTVIDIPRACGENFFISRGLSYVTCVCTCRGYV